MVDYPHLILLQNERMVDIADIPFSQVSDDDKRQFASKIKETGSYRGFKPRQFWVRYNSNVLSKVLNSRLSHHRPSTTA